MRVVTNTKFIFIVVFQFFFFFFSNTSIGQTAWDYKKEKTRERFPKFSCTIDSVKYNNETLKGKIAFINFWFAACPPCVAEIDALNNVYLKLKNNPSFIFLSVSVDEPEEINMFIDKFNIQFPVLYLPKSEVQKMGMINGYPTSIILNKDGFVIYKKSGGSSFKKEAKRIVEKEVYPEILKALKNNKS